MAKKGLRVDLDEELLRLFKSECALGGTTMKAKMEELIAEWLKAHQIAVPPNIVVGGE